MKAHYLLRWVTHHGDKGPWSETVSATIAGWYDEGLANGTKYYFAVKDRNSAGESAFSAVVNRRTY
jgi:hypothetical protein